MALLPLIGFRHSMNLAAWMAVCLLASSGEAQADGWQGFQPPVRYAMGAPVVSFGSDRTRDGSPRGIVVGTNGRGAAVFRGFENGLFQQRRDIPGGFVVSVAMDYFNADTIPDLVVPSYFGASFTIYMGTPDGGFAPGATYPVEGHCTWVATGDLNGDGKIDIAAGHNGSGQPLNLYVFLGGGDGTFSRFQKYPTPIATPTDIILTNVDSDGHSDIAYSVSGPQTGALFRGNGDGTFEAPEFIADIDSTDANGDSRGFSLADMDADGHLDWIDALDFIDSLVVRRGDGAGGFSPGTRLFLPHPFDVTTADLDGDGKVDIIASNLDSIVCYLQDQHGAFAAAATLHPSGGPVALLASDVNNDGLPDVVFSSLDSSFSVLINKGRSTTGVEPPPSQVTLLPNFPNPFARATVFRYRLSQRGRVRLAVYDLLGRRVATLADRVDEPGTHEVRFDASRLAAGAYFCRLVTHGAVKVRRMTVLR